MIQQGTWSGRCCTALEVRALVSCHRQPDPHRVPPINPPTNQRQSNKGRLVPPSPEVVQCLHIVYHSTNHPSTNQPSTNQPIRLALQATYCHHLKWCRASTMPPGPSWVAGKMRSCLHSHPEWGGRRRREGGETMRHRWRVGVMGFDGMHEPRHMPRQMCISWPVCMPCSIEMKC